jgi:inosose dehydratase
MSPLGDPMSRRAFVGALAGGVALGAVTHRVRRLKVGHTGITWGYAPPNAERAAADIAGLGYHAMESFGSVLAWWETRGGFRAVLDRHGLPLRAAYCPFELTDAAKRAQNLANAARWGRLIRECGGTIAVVGPSAVARPGFDMKRERAGIVAALNEVGKALADQGVTGALHPHTGSCVQTRDDVYAVMEAVDTRVVKLAPDVGELLAGGADPLPVLRDFLPVIRHAHLKDHDGGPAHDGYCAVGRGRVDMAAVVDTLERSSEDLTLMVELNPASNAGSPDPLATARASRDHLRTLGYSFTR